MKLVALLLAAVAWGVVMAVCFIEGHPGWTVVLGILGALAALDVADS